MKLSQLFSIFLEMTDTSFVFSQGFDTPHSYRGYYTELAFQPAEDIKLHDIIKSLDRAYIEVFEGYKGGDYKYNMTTACHLAWIGNCTEDDYLRLGSLVAEMVAEYNSRINK